MVHGGSGQAVKYGSKPSMAAPPSGWSHILGVVHVDGLAVANTKIGTTENKGRRFYPTAGFFALSSVTGTLTVAATASIGVTAAAYADVVAASPVTGLAAANNLFRIALLTTGPSIAPNVDVYCRVSVAAVGVGLTVYDLIVGLEGLYL